MKIFESEHLDSLYFQMVNALINEGVEIEKKNKIFDDLGGKYIKELYSCVIRISKPQEGILYIKGRAYNPAFAVAETLWNITADTDCWLANYNKLYLYYFDGKRDLNSGYGNRIFNWGAHLNQFELVVNRFKEESTTQHADIIIFDPTFDLCNPLFVPCITKIKFRIRNSKLYMITNMRAQDVWRGFPYDINLLLTIYQLMLNRLKKEIEFADLEYGTYEHHCDVLRLYRRNYQEAQNLIRLNQGENLIKKNSSIIDLNGQCDFESYKQYKDLIKSFSFLSIDELLEKKETVLEMLDNIPQYWKNSISICFAYCLIKQNEYQEAIHVLSLVDNIYKNQFIEWCNYYMRVNLA